MRSASLGVAVMILMLTMPASASAAGANRPPLAPRSFGVAVPGLPTNLAVLDALQSLVGRPSQIVGYFQDFASGPHFDAVSATSIRLQGSTPMLAWQPEDWSGPGANQPNYTLASIINGSYDRLVTRWAREIHAWGHPLLLRFAPEMNGNWTPWSEGVNGNTAGQYVVAWRHVHDLFVRAGARNVRWVWNPNVDFSGSTPLAGLYPGDGYVDAVGLDGYNWGTSQPWSSWQSPAQVFDGTLADVRSLTQRPIVLTEVASAEVGGDKAAWITDFFSYLNANPDIRSFVWFDFNKETDWRVDSSTASTQAFTAGLSGW